MGRLHGENEAGWELKKENVLPIKCGRSAKALNKVLCQAQDPWDSHSAAVPSSRDSRLHEQQQAFEDRVSAGDADDPLKPWLRYIKWAQRTFPSGGRLPLGSGVMELLERCTRTFRREARYRNDERYIKVWIRYADLLKNPSDVFKFMRANRIGEEVALYYVATAWAAEKRGNFKLADVAYRKGVARGAKPESMLKQRQREFLRRLGRKMLAETTVDGAVDRDKGARNRRGRRRKVPNASSVNGGGGQGQQPHVDFTEQQQTRDSERCPLGRLRHATLHRGAVVPMQRASGIADDSQNGAKKPPAFVVLDESVAAGSGSIGGACQPAWQPSNTPPPNESGAKEDDSCSGGNRIVSWDDLHSNRAGAKENVAGARKWSGAEIPSEVPVRAAPAAFAVFEEAGNDAIAIGRGACATAHDTAHLAHGHTASRQMNHSTREASVSGVDSITGRCVDTSAVSPPPPPPPGTVSSAQAGTIQVSRSAQEDEEDITIHTKLVRVLRVLFL